MYRCHNRPSAEDDSARAPNNLCRSQSEVVDAGLAKSAKTNGEAAQCNGTGAGHAQPYACLKRRHSTVKFGYHLAVPLARRTPGGSSGDANTTSSTAKNVIALVGLPARGKTYISKKLSRYLNWIGITTKVFNLGEYRRRLKPTYENHEFFSSDNKEGNELRERVCSEALEDVVHWLENEEGEVAVFDATNTTRKRRAKLYQRLVEDKGYNLFFVESVCDRQDIIDSNIREVKITSPDYTQREEADVVNDFKARIRHYEEQYETLDENLEPDYSFLKIFNAGEKVLVHKHEGHIQSRIVYYLMNVHLTKRTIYLTRHGESQYNLSGQLGGDSTLTTRGHRFARLLGEYVRHLPHSKLKVWTSWLTRTIQTASNISGVQERWKALNEIDVGACDGMTYAEIRDKMPDEFSARDEDKFGYRYPRGESYEDLVARLEPVIMELERQDSVLVIAHQAVIRCLLAYYLETPEDSLPWLEVPMHTVIKLEPIAYGCNVEFIKFPVDCANTHRKKPKEPGLLDERFISNVPLIENRRNHMAASTKPSVGSVANGQHPHSGSRRVGNNSSSSSSSDEDSEALFAKLFIDDKLRRQTIAPVDRQSPRKLN